MIAVLRLGQRGGQDHPAASLKSPSCASIARTNAGTHAESGIASHYSMRELGTKTASGRAAW
jgi:hypothetical protein